MVATTYQCTWNILVEVIFVSPEVKSEMFLGFFRGNFWHWKHVREVQLEKLNIESSHCPYLQTTPAAYLKSLYQEF